MGKTVFVSVSLKNRPVVSDQLAVIGQILAKHEFVAQIFVDQFTFLEAEAKTMMLRAREAIDACEFLIAEVSHKAIGVGVEVGYAVGCGKPVIYVRSEESEHSTTIDGMADHVIVYRSLDDLATALGSILHVM